MKAKLSIIMALAMLAGAGCGDSTCDERCDDLASQCGESADECSGDCDDTETECEACFGCLKDNSLCEIEPGGACAGPCKGCRGN